MARWRSLRKMAALFSGIMLGLGLLALGGATRADAQTYVCPPGYYFLANYGCYPMNGYVYAAPAPPPYYYYPPPSYYAYPPQFGLSFRFGDHDRDHFDHDHFEHHH